MRLDSNQARGTFNQLRVVLLHNLTYKLYSLYYQIEAIESELEVRFTFSLKLFIVQSMMVLQVEIDKQQLNNVEIVTSAEVPRPVDGEHILIHSRMMTSHDSFVIPSATATPVNNHVHEPTLPLPVTVP
jgi:hypothetical protein